MIDCPYCRGRKMALQQLNPGGDWVDGKCRDCGGSGRVEDAIGERYILGNRLQGIRTSRGVTLVGAARALGATPEKIWSMEVGRSEPSAAYLAWCGVERGDSTMNSVNTQEMDG